MARTTAIAAKQVPGSTLKFKRFGSADRQDGSAAIDAGVLLRN
jgi:hypothetical protein